jgi:tape measure domain-containing protein
MARAQRLGEIYVEINGRLDKFEKDMKKARMSSERSQKKMQRVFDKVNFGKARQSLMRFNTLLATVAGGYAFKQLAGHALETAASFEQMEVKLNQLTGGRGKGTLEELNEWAIKMPVNTMEAVNAFVMMQAMGLDPTIRKMQILTDVGSILGDDVLRRVSLQLGQTAAMGKLMGQEIRVLGEAGIDARKYLMDAFGMTLEQVQKSGMNIKIILKAIFDGMEKDFGGASEKMMKSWRGLRVTFQSYVMELERRVMNAGVFDALKGHLDDINTRLWKWIENNEDLIKQRVPEYIDKVEESLSKIWSFIGSNKDILSYGLIGLALFGKKGAIIGAAAGAEMRRIVAITKAMEMYQEGQLSLSAILKSMHPKAKISLEQLVGADIKKGVDEYTHEMHRLKAVHQQTVDDVTKGWGEEAISGLLVEWDTPFVQKLLGTPEEAQKAKSVFDDIKNDIVVIAEETTKAYKARLQRYTEARADDLDILGVGLWNAEPPEGAIDAYIEKIQRYVEAREEEFGALGVGLWIPDEKAEEGFKKWIELSERTAWAMQDNFSSVFYDAVKGELKTFEDYMGSIFDSILRAWSDLMGQMITQWIFGDLAGGGGGLFGELGKLFGFEKGGVIPLASGGVINKPTIFPFASGVGLAGESGPEAILPLGRTETGDLGVKSSGGQGITVNLVAQSLDPATSHEMLMQSAGSIAEAINSQIGVGNRGLLHNLREVNK